MFSFLEPAELVRKSKGKGVTLWVEEGRLCFDAPCGLPPDLASLLRQHKPALLAYLKERALTLELAPLPPIEEEENSSQAGASLDEPSNDDCEESPPPNSKERPSPASPLASLPEAQRQELLSFVATANAGGWDLEATTRYTLPLLPGLTEEQICEAWGGGSEEGRSCDGEDNDCDNTPSPPRALPHPPGGKPAYLKEHASEEELALIEPPASLSIAELYERVRERALFFERWPRYQEAIRWRLQEGWSVERVLTYLQRYQPGVTLEHIEHAARQEPALTLPQDEERPSPPSPDLPTEKPVAWSVEAARLIEWFRSAFEAGELPGEPFDLAPWIRVEEPYGFYQKLLFDIEGGPAGPRARYGAVQEALRRLRVVISPSLPAETNLPKPSQQEGSTHSKQAGSFEDTRASRKEQER